MMTRYTNPKVKEYPDYGGRGIKVCERWHSFENFLTDMGERPPGMSIDRHPNNDGNYEPGNCRWATRTQQARNKRNSRLLTVNGVTRCVAEWAEIMGVRDSVIRDRLRGGWSEEDAVLKPLPRS